jgi:trimethylamine:corrinoid methyltransferase-like protein
MFLSRDVLSERRSIASRAQAMTILSEIGSEVHHEGALELLRGHPQAVGVEVRDQGRAARGGEVP